MDKDIIAVETALQVANHDETITKDRLNFGLVEVVYEWARNKVNSTSLCIYSILIPVNISPLLKS